MKWKYEPKKYLCAKFSISPRIICFLANFLLLQKLRSWSQLYKLLVNCWFRPAALTRTFGFWTILVNCHALLWCKVQRLDFVQRCNRLKAFLQPALGAKCCQNVKDAPGLAKCCQSVELHNANGAPGLAFLHLYRFYSLQIFILALGQIQSGRSDIHATDHVNFVLLWYISNEHEAVNWSIPNMTKHDKNSTRDTH